MIDLKILANSYCVICNRYLDPKVSYIKYEERSSVRFMSLPRLVGVKYELRACMDVDCYTKIGPIPLCELGLGELK